MWYNFEDLLMVYGLVAQLDRASACGAEGRRFDPCRGHHKDSPNGGFLLSYTW
jgi:hypothetical protein